MNSSGSSLGLSVEIEEIKNTAMGETSLLPEGGGSLLVGPVSEIGVEEVAFWRQKLYLSTNCYPYSRDQVSSLIAEVSRAVNISPGQLNPPARRILIAMQNLGDLEGLVVGIAEVLYCYSVSPLNGRERSYHLHPRGRMLPVQELSSIRGVIPGLRGAEALEEYKKALEVMAARKAAIHRKRSRASVFKPSISASRSCSKALASLDSEVFPMTLTRPSLDEDTSKVMSQLFYLKGRMKNRSATKAERDALAIRLREEKDAILAKDEEIEAWKLRSVDLSLKLGFSWGKF
ncbi:hypothetical protein YC2023_107891 [Brassica napus]